MLPSSSKKKYIAVIHAYAGPQNKALAYAEMLVPIIEREVLIIYPQETPALNTNHETLQLPFWKQPTLWNDLIEERDISFFLFEIGKTGLSLKKTLIELRHLRVPYLAIPSTLADVVSPQLFIVPVGMLPEEKEKGVFTSALSRKTGAKVKLITAKAYGSRSRHNSNAIKTLLEKQNVEIEHIQGKKSSEKVDFEGLYLSNGNAASMLWISATREYALDDIVFGPKELRLLRKCHIPVMLLNPRGDLYAFCE